MSNLPFCLNETNTIGTIIISKQFFEEPAVLAAMAKYTPSYYISVEPANTSDVRITVQDKGGKPLQIVALKAMMNELIDQQIRVDLNKHFGEMRKIIVRHAFEPVEL